MAQKIKKFCKNSLICHGYEKSIIFEIVEKFNFIRPINNDTNMLLRVKVFGLSGTHGALF